MSRHSSRAILRQFLSSCKRNSIASGKRKKLIKNLKLLYKQESKWDPIWQLGQMLRGLKPPMEKDAVIKYGEHEIVDWHAKYLGQPSAKGDMDAARKYLKEHGKK